MKYTISRMPPMHSVRNIRRTIPSASNIVRYGYRFHRLLCVRSWHGDMESRADDVLLMWTIHRVPVFPRRNASVGCATSHGYRSNIARLGYMLLASTRMWSLWWYFSSEVCTLAARTSVLSYTVCIRSSPVRIFVHGPRGGLNMSRVFSSWIVFHTCPVAVDLAEHVANGTVAPLVYCE